MNKSEAMAYGVREDAYRVFQEHCSKDARKIAEKMAARMVEEAKGRETAPAPAAALPGAIRRAINSILALIDDPSRLSLILGSVNRQYQEYQHEQRKGKDAPEQAQEAAMQDNTQKPPEIVQEGACKCP